MGGDRIGILGGTFNPIHWGHLLLAEAAQEQFDLTKIVWVPNPIPPHKPQHRQVAFYHRLAMIRRAIAPYPKFCLFTVDPDPARPSFAVETLDHLKTHYSMEYPDCRWAWIIGLDAFLTLPRWRQVEDVAPFCTWLIGPRFRDTALNLSGSDESIAPRKLKVCSGEPPTHSLIDPHIDPGPIQKTTQIKCEQVTQSLRERLNFDVEWHLINMPVVSVSSSLIRQRCGDRHPIYTLVPEAVRTYIEENQLYQQF